MLLFHGSNLTIDRPRLIGQTRGLDFGSGFYLTTDRVQAERFSETVVRRRGDGTPTVTEYEFDLALAEKILIICRFATADGEWLQFVKENRLKQYSGVKHDIVIGPVANDNVMPTIQAYFAGFLSEDAAIMTLKTKKLTDQICLKSEKAISLLNFSNSYESR